MKSAGALFAFAAVVLSASGCAGAPVEPVTVPAHAASAVPRYPEIGGSFEGVVERTSREYALRGDDGKVVILVDATTGEGVRLARHIGQRVLVTGLFNGMDNGVRRVSAGSLRVARGGEFDKVIAAIATSDCKEAGITPGDKFLLISNQELGEGDVNVSVAQRGRTFNVWMVHDASAPNGYRLKSVNRAAGKVLVAVCPAR